MLYWYLIPWALTFVSLVKADCNISTLRFVMVMTRHGSRSPSFTYPTDPYPYTNRTIWPDGPMQLTKLGKQQLYITGEILRQQYRGFLNDHYIPEENTMQTDRVDRDFTSLACLLAGLYPPRDYQIWNPSLLWQPIPIWVDEFNNYDPGQEYQQFLIKKSQTNFALTEYRYKDQWLFNYVSMHIGTVIDKIIGLLGVWEALHLQKENGYELPEWTKAVYPDLLTDFHLRFIQYAYCDTHEITGVIGGPIFKILSDILVEKAEGKNNPESKLHIFAEHDSTLAMVFCGLGIPTNFVIETSAFLVFELHQTLNGFEVQFRFSDSHSTCAKGLTTSMQGKKQEEERFFIFLPDGYHRIHSDKNIDRSFASLMEIICQKIKLGPTTPSRAGRSIRPIGRKASLSYRKVTAIS